MGGCDVDDPSALDAEPPRWMGTELYDDEQVPDDVPRLLDEPMRDEDSGPTFEDEMPDVTAEIGAQAGATWTQWYDRDNPDGSGDWELRELQSGVCPQPSGVQCRTVQGLYLWETGENVSCSLDGLLCKNVDQPDGTCDHDYKVRFQCPEPAEPPSAVITYLQPIGATCVGPLVGFSGLLSTAGSSPINEYRWDFDDDGVVELTTQSGFQSWTYSGSSTEVACLTVVDTAGLSDTACTSVVLCE